MTNYCINAHWRAHCTQDYFGFNPVYMDSVFDTDDKDIAQFFDFGPKAYAEW